MKPVVLLTKDRPPSEPPPLSETITPHIEHEQWVDDTITSAIQSLAQQDVHNAIELSTSQYTPCIKKFSTNRAINESILAKQRTMNTKRTHKPTLQCTLQPPIVYEMHIPTPKAQSQYSNTPPSNVIHNTTWKDDPTHHWTLNKHGQWDTDQTQSTPLRPPCQTPDDTPPD